MYHGELLNMRTLFDAYQGARIPLRAFFDITPIFRSCLIGSLNSAPRLEDVIEEAERESKILAYEINRWLLQESASFLEGKEEMHSRSRRSIDEDEGGTRMDTNLLSEVSQLVVRRDVGNKDKKHPKEENGSSVVKGKVKKVNSVPVAKRHQQNVRISDSIRLLKKQGLGTQADKHHAKKSATNKKTDKLKTKADELSKANLVKALIEGDSGAKEAYKELAEFIAASSSDQPTIETNSKKSDIARPSTKAKGSHKKLTKKHKHVLDILSKLAPNVLRKYFHRKGLDKYWKVMENIRKINAAKKRKNAAKQSKKERKVMDSNASISKAKQDKREKLKAHKDVKNVKQKVIATKEPNSSSEIKHLEKDVLLKKQVNLHKNAPQKEVSQHKDKAATKLHKPEHPKSSSKEIVIVEPAVETYMKKSKKAKNVAADHQTKRSHKTVEELYSKEIPQPHKDEKKNLFKVIKSKDAVKVVKGNEKIVSKSAQTSKEVGSHAKDYVTNKIHEKLKSPEVKDTLKQEPEKKVSETVTVRGTAPAKNIKDKPKDANDSTAPATKAVKVETSQVKPSASPVKSKKMLEPIHAVENKDSSTNKIKNPQEEKATLQHQVNAVVISAPNKPIVADEKPTEIPKTPAVTAPYVIKTTHAQQPEVKHDKSSQAKQENPASGKIDFLKEKIRKTNNLKFKVAQALLAHCETQNRLRQVFDQVNSSLKKAAVLAKAIGNKFGIKQSDIENLTSQHTEGAVEQFLNQLF